MKTSRIGDVARVTGGGTPRKSCPAFYGGSVPWVTPKDMKSWRIGDSLVRLTPEGVAQSPAKLVEPGSVLVVVRSGVLKHTLPVAIATAPVTVNQDLKVLTPGSAVLGSFLARFVKWQQPTILGWVRATTADNFPIDRLLDLAIPVPSLDDQARICGVLDEADRLRMLRGRTESHLADLRAALLQSAVSHSTTETALLGDVADVAGGLQVTAKRAPLPLEVPYLRVANVYRGRLALDQIKTLRVTPRELERARLLDGDVLVVEGHGNPDEVGRAAVWSGAISDCVHQNHLIRVRFHSGRVLPAVGAAWLNSERGRRHLLRSAKTTSGLNTISSSNVKSCPVPLIPMSEQQRLVQKFETLTRQSVLASDSAGGLQSMFLSVQERTFTEGL